MAELLIVVAVIAVLSGVGFIAVQERQEKLAQLERDTIAKEIFFAAQNHLTMAESQGYLGIAEAGFGKEETGTDKNIYYVVKDKNAPAAGSILDLMLPFGAIDETVRSGGSYLIRYQKDPAIVLDVYYCTLSGKPEKYNHEIKDEDYTKLHVPEGGEKPKHDWLVGHYGGLEAGLIGDYDVLQAPEIIVENKERLVVKVKDNTLQAAKAHDANGTLVAANPYLEVIITGETTNENKTPKAVILLKRNGTSVSNNRVSGPDADGFFTVVLDDITGSPEALDTKKDGLHFADLNKYIENEAKVDSNNIWFISDPTSAESDKIPFRPGEDITVEAVTFSNNTFTNIAYSNAITTNSLFADNVTDAGTVDHNIVKIANFRHLENLDPAISKMASDFKPSSNNQIQATQMENLDWAAFRTAIASAKDEFDTEDDVVVYKKDINDQYVGMEKGCYMPINPDYALTYDGGIEVGTDGPSYHKITGVKVAGPANSNDGRYNGPGGLFGSVEDTALTVKNLELIDFSINCTGNAGALAGELGKDQGPVILITNVLAHNRKTGTTTIASSSGSAGGLIGSMTGATVQKCAAAMVVSSISGNAGGLIGESHGTSTVTASYSGGRTKAKKESNDTTASGYKDTNPAYNVTGGAGAGGLIGDQGQTTIDYCYSTCSVSGTTAGGLVGKTGGTINHSYCTGLVNGTNKGAFAGQKPTIEAGNDAVCWYFQIINKPENATDYLPPAPNCASGDESDPAQGSGVEKIAKLKRLDADAKSYNDFCGAPANWKVARPTEASGLTVLYPATDSDDEEVAKYNLKTVKQLGADVVETATATTPADFVATHYGDWPAPEILVVNTKSGSQNQNTNP